MSSDDDPREELCRTADTTLGPKREPGSYRSIAQSLGVEASEVLFVSDVIEEDAAAEAGSGTALSIREGGPLPDSTHRVVRRFDELD